MALKTKRKTEFGADEEADKILDKLPRLSRARDGIAKGTQAVVYINDAGTLCILLNGDGALSVHERNLAYVHGDELVGV